MTILDLKRGPAQTSRKGRRVDPAPEEAQATRRLNMRPRGSSSRDGRPGARPASDPRTGRPPDPTWYAPTGRRIASGTTRSERLCPGATGRRCSSPASVRSRWVKNELYALNESRLEDRIVPILAMDCDWRGLSWALGAISVDFRGGFREGMDARGGGEDYLNAPIPVSSCPIASVWMSCVPS
jgi:hypothetical protein